MEARGGGVPKSWVVIPARGGSKGIPGKNLVKVGGRSLVERAITASLAAGTADQVVVSTDDETIAERSRRAGAFVVTRPVELADDGASSESAVLHALGELEALDDDVVALVQCTSPFVAPDDIAATIDAVRQGADSAFAAVPFHRFVWRDGPDGTAVGVNHTETPRLRRQDRRPEWLESGSVYAMRVGGFRAAGHRFYGRIVVVPGVGRDLEIDEPADLEFARQVATLEARHLTWPWRELPVLVVLDFDGVLTDDRVWTLDDGREAVVSTRADGMGVALLRSLVPVVVLSTEVNPVVSARCAKLLIACVQGVGHDKMEALRTIAAQRCVSLADVAYVGNDLNDLGPLNAVGYPIAVRDAHPSVRAAAQLILSRPGGRGAVRELSDMLIAAH
jgi:YrbI family 3-deoxy-D-manno-octulosonate 8-phosphate phosphatase